MVQQAIWDEVKTIFRRIRSWLKWWNVAVAILVLYAWFNLLEIQSTGMMDLERHESRSGTSIVTAFVDMDNKKNLVPGELPGYTGWGRNEFTLAKYFSVNLQSVRQQQQQARVGEDFIIPVRCSGHEDCSRGNSFFFLRAYGPSVISGLVVNQGNGSYQMKFRPMDVGFYTVEVVLVFSNPQGFDEFPIPKDQTEAEYEGYLLPGFPFQINVQDRDSSDKYKTGATGGEKADKPICSFNHLTEDSPISALSKARWKVTSKANTPGYDSTTLGQKVSEKGYKENINSLGIQMEYDYLNCTLLSKEAFQKKGSSNPFNKQCGGLELQVVFIGDSTMRVQWNRFEEMVKGIKNVATEYINLYGGYRRCEKFGPDIKNKLELASLRAPNSKIAIIFNSGLHDIHRLCGSEWTDDRLEYLDKNLLKSSKFSCLNEYKSIVKDFADLIYQYPADLRIFQSTTAAWPKYGNYGIQWGSFAQKLPMDATFVSPFNDISFDILKAYENKIHIVDGYWITYPRPDNREVGDVGNKLSHPGLEVQGAMARIWAMLIIEKLC